MKTSCTRSWFVSSGLLVRYFLLFICVLNSSGSFAQLQVTPNNNAAQLAQSLSGIGVVISNATMNCPAGACGTFNGTTSNLGITSGVLLTTGQVAEAVGPNNNGGAGYDNGVVFSDPNLVAVEPMATYDPCILEFDAVPSCSTLAFTFSFGSEEYMEFVNAGFNDVYGIFVTGPNPAGPAYTGYNMALLPSPPAPAGTPVSIDNVNNGSYPQYYVDNENPVGQTVQYDGFTKPIKIIINVKPCATYHFKLAIADAGDGILDSGVFFELASLACNPLPIVLTTTTTPANCSVNNGTATVNPSGGTPPYTYTWNTTPAQITPTATGLAPGTYSVMVADNSGCFFTTTTVTVTGGGGFTSTISSTPSVCSSANATATVTPTGGTTPYTYQWSPAGGANAVATGLAAGNYSVLVTDASGCTGSYTVAVSVIGGFTLNTSSSPALCFAAANGTATATPTGGTAPFTYQWSPGGGANAVATGLAVGTYSVLVTDVNGCTQTQTVAITQPTAVNVSIIDTTNVSCIGNTDGSATAAGSGGTGNLTYSWNTTPAQTNAIASNLAAGNYVVTIKDSNGCTSSQSVTITGPAAVNGNIVSSINVSCFGGKDGSATANATGGTGVITYSWNTTPPQTGAVATNLSPGNYSVTMQDANGCSATQTVLITQPTALAASTSSLPASCGLKDGSATVTPTGGTLPYTYLWLINPSVQLTSTATGLGPGTYSVVITDANGCSMSPQAVSVSGGLPPIADFSFNPDVVNLLDPITTFTDHSSGNVAFWSWNFGDPKSGAKDSSFLQNPYHTYSDTGTYCVTLFIADPKGGCRDTIVKCLKVESPFTIYIPNSFTPNNDGVNEVFLAYGTYIKDFQMLVFDRWGNKLFESKDLSYGWNGKVKNKGDSIVQEDVYVWKVYVKDFHNIKHNYIGRVTLVK